LTPTADSPVGAEVPLGQDILLVAILALQLRTKQATGRTGWTSPSQNFLVEINSTGGSLRMGIWEIGGFSQWICGSQKGCADRLSVGRQTHLVFEAGRRVLRL
jgi:hypothetical protein